MAAGQMVLVITLSRIGQSNPCRGGQQLASISPSTMGFLLLTSKFTGSGHGKGDGGGSRSREACESCGLGQTAIWNKMVFPD
jgi:hypothetical protein